MFKQSLLFISQEHVWLRVHGIIKNFSRLSSYQFTSVIDWGACISRIITLMSLNYRFNLFRWADTLEFLGRKSGFYLFKSSNPRIFSVLVNRFSYEKTSRIILIIRLKLVLWFDIAKRLEHELIWMHWSRLFEVLECSHVVSIQMLILLNHFFVVPGNILQCINIPVDYVSFNILGDVLSEFGSFDLSILVHVYVCWDSPKTTLFRIHQRRTIGWSVNVNHPALFDHGFHGDRILWYSIIFHDVHSLFECMIGYAHLSLLNTICGRCMTSIIKKILWFSHVSWFVFWESLGRRLTFNSPLQIHLLTRLRCPSGLEICGFLLLRNLIVCYVVFL